MVSNKNTLILFDVGGVLLKLNFSGFNEKAAAINGNMTAEEFKHAYLKSGLETRRLKGQITTRQFLEELRKLINPAASTIEIEKAFFKVHHAPIKKMILLKEKLGKHGYAVGIFSNASEISQRALHTKFGRKLLSTYNGGPAIFSHKAKSAKPDDGMYEKIKGYGKVIFIDDKAANLRKGIEKFGWQGIHYTANIDSLEADKPEHDKTTKNLKKATSAKQVISALRSFDVKI